MRPLPRQSWETRGSLPGHTTEDVDLYRALKIGKRSQLTTRLAGRDPQLSEPKHLVRSDRTAEAFQLELPQGRGLDGLRDSREDVWPDQDLAARCVRAEAGGDRKSTRLNSSLITISYAVFCLKKKK